MFVVTCLFTDSDASADKNDMTLQDIESKLLKSN